MSMADQLCLFSRFSFGFLFRLTRLLRLTRRFHGICGVTVTAIEPDGVCYRDKACVEHKISCGTVLYSVGTKENFDEAMGLYGAVANTRMIGDCEKAGNVQKAVRSGYAGAMLL